MKSILVLFLTGIGYTAASQQIHIPDRTPVDFINFKYNLVKLPKAKPVTGINFTPTGITVLDLRFDTSLVGFMNKATPSKKYLALRNGTASGVTQFLKKLFSQSFSADSAAIELFAVIQKLWLSDDIRLAQTTGAATKNDFQQKGVIIQVAYFLKVKDAYVPLLKFDSSFTGPHSINTQGGEYIAAALRKSIEAMRGVDAKRIFGAGKKYSYSYIEALYKSRFLCPVVSAEPQKGVYTSFEEFQKNQPAITEFSIQSDNTADQLYCKNASGNEVLCSNSFAVSDGQYFYMQVAGRFYKLFRSGNTFNFCGPERPRQASASKFIDPLFGPNYMLPGVGFSTAPGAHSGATVQKRMFMYQLDMDTGSFH